MKTRNAVCNWFCINKSGSNYPIYDYNISNNTYTRVGTLYNREAFIFLGGDNFDYIKFLASNGTLKTACIDPSRYPVPISYCTDYPYSTEIIDNMELCVFRMRSAKNLYNTNAVKIKTLPAGTLVATNNVSVGDSHHDWKLVSYYKEPGGTWQQIDAGQGGAGYGFVDSGIASASGYSSIAFYGSW